MKRPIFAILALAIGVTTVVGPVSSAHADQGCLTGQVDVTGTPSRHNYSYVLACPDGSLNFNLQVSGSYDVSTTRAQEKLTGDRGIVEASWDHCAGDPWIAAAPACNETSIYVQAGGETGSSTGGGSCLLVDSVTTYHYDGPFGGDLSVPDSPSVPCSVQLLSPYEVNALNAQLQNALNQQHQPPSAAGPAAVPLSTRLGLPPAPTSIVGKPSNFGGKRDGVFGTTDILSWDPSGSASFYVLRAVGHQSGTALALDSQASDIPGSQHSYVVTGTAAQVQGGTDFYLKACSAPGVCGAESTTFVPGP